MARGRASPGLMQRPKPGRTWTPLPIGVHTDQLQTSAGPFRESGVKLFPSFCPVFLIFFAGTPVEVGIKGSHDQISLGSANSDLEYALVNRAYCENVLGDRSVHQNNRTPGVTFGA